MAHIKPRFDRLAPAMAQTVQYTSLLHPTGAGVTRLDNAAKRRHRSADEAGQRMRTMASKSGKSPATKKKTTASRSSATVAHAKPKDGAGKNPLLAKWTTPFEMPPFDRVKAKHFMPAFDRTFADNIAEIEAIAADPAKPTFANTVEALERAGRGLDRAAGVFYNLAGTDTTDETPEDRARSGTAFRQARHARLSERQTVPPRRCPVQEEGQPRPQRGTGARAGALSPQLHPLRRGARCQGAQADGRDCRASGDAGHQVQPECAGGRAGLSAGAGNLHDELAGLPEAVRAAAAQTATSVATRASTRSACPARASSRS